MIYQNDKNENTQNQFSNALKELQIGKLLRNSNITKSCGISAYEVFQFLLLLVFQGRNLFRFVNYSVTELPEHLNRGGIPPFSGCVHDTTTVYSFELYSYFYDFRCFQSGHGQFFFYSGYGEIFSQDIICTDSIRIIILLSISV